MAPLAGPRQTGTTAALLSALAAPPPPPGSGSAHGTSSSIRRIGGLNDELHGGSSASLQASGVVRASCMGWEGVRMHHAPCTCSPACMHAWTSTAAACQVAELFMQQLTCSMLSFGRKGMQGTTPGLMHDVRVGHVWHGIAFVTCGSLHTDRGPWTVAEAAQAAKHCCDTQFNSPAC